MNWKGAQNDNRHRGRMRLIRRLINKANWHRLATSPTGAMKTLSWNSYRLGNLLRFQALHDIVRKEDPNIVILQETKLKVRQIEKCKFRLGFDNYLVVDCNGRSGGLALLWKNEVLQKVNNYSKSHIDAQIKKEGSTEAE